MARTTAKQLERFGQQIQAIFDEALRASMPAMPAVVPREPIEVRAQAAKEDALEAAHENLKRVRANPQSAPRDLKDAIGAVHAALSACGQLGAPPNHAGDQPTFVVEFTEPNDVEIRAEPEAPGRPDDEVSVVVGSSEESQRGRRRRSA